MAYLRRYCSSRILEINNGQIREYCGPIKYTLDGKDSENGPYSASTIYTFLKDYYYAKPPEEQKEMNLLIRDVFDDSFFAPDALFNSLQKEMQQ